MKFVKNGVYWNSDNNGNIHPINTIKKYIIDNIDCTIQLKDVPVYKTIVIKKLITVLNKDDMVRDFVETDDKITNENQFKVDYITNTIQFHISQKGKGVMVKFWSDGKVVQSAKSVYVEKDESGNIGESVAVAINSIKNDVLEVKEELSVLNPSSCRTKQTKNLAKVYKKLQDRQGVKFCLYGDSLMYGMDIQSTDKRPPIDITYNDGSKPNVTIGSDTIHEAFARTLKSVYGEGITVDIRAWSGDWVSSAITRHKPKSNPSLADICIMEYGVNDSRLSYCPYKGNVDEFIRQYRILIEAEINSGSAIVLLSPFKMRISNDTNVQSFEIAIKLLGQEYGIPVIIGDEFLENFPYTYYSDQTHLNGTAYKNVGTRLASCFIGNGIFNPINTTENTVLLTRKQIDGVYYSGSGIYPLSTSNYPTPCEFEDGKGIALVINDGCSAYYSFYANNDMYILPYLGLNSAESIAKISLDFDIPQVDSSLDCYPNYNNPTSFNVTEPSYVEYTSANMIDYRISPKAIFEKNLPVLRLVRKGWHTISVSSKGGSLGLGALVFVDINYFNYVLKNGNSVVNGDFTVNGKLNSTNEISLSPTNGTDFTAIGTRRSKDNIDYRSYLGLYVKTDGMATGLSFYKNNTEVNRLNIGETYIEPLNDNQKDLGRSGVRFKDIYASNGVVNTSDRNYKKDIVDNVLGLDFINKLKTVEYKFIEGDSNRVHNGLIAQDVELVLGEMDRAMLVKSKFIDEETGIEKEIYALRYNELVAPLIKAVQELSTKVKELEQRGVI